MDIRNVALHSYQIIYVTKLWTVKLIVVLRNMYITAWNDYAVGMVL